MPVPPLSGMPFPPSPDGGPRRGWMPRTAGENIPWKGLSKQEGVSLCTSELMRVGVGARKCRLSMELWQFLGNLHPKLVQLPLVLLPAGLLFDLAGVLRPRAEWLHRAGKVLCVAGTVALLFAFICGIYAEVWAGRAGVPQQAIEWHELVANVASWGFVLLAAWRLFLEAGRHRRLLALYAVVGLGYYS